MIVPVRANVGRNVACESQLASSTFKIKLNLFLPDLSQPSITNYAFISEH